jgi:hypothetical protein
LREHAPRHVLALVGEQVHDLSPYVFLHPEVHALDRLAILFKDVGHHVAQLLGELGIFTQESARKRPEVPG